MQPFEPAFLVLLGLMATAAWLDVMQRRLPNWLCLAVVLTGGVAAAMQSSMLRPRWGSDLPKLCGC
jgi:Flp pilus assembly protein protease CpaA